MLCWWRGCCRSGEGLPKGGEVIFEEGTGPFEDGQIESDLHYRIDVGLGGVTKDIVHLLRESA